MPRGSSGTFTLAEPAFVPNTVISSSAMNSDLSDIALGLTQSLATTGVSTMTGPIKAASGSATNPPYTFGSDTNTGLYLAGTDQIGLATGGVLCCTFNSDQSVTFAGGVTIAGTLSITSSVSLASNLHVGGDLDVTGTASLASGVLVAKSTVVNTTKPIGMANQGGTPSQPSSGAVLYIKSDGFSGSNRPYVLEASCSTTWPLMFTGGQCKLTKSGANLLLSPYQGNRLSINGVPQIVPDAGVTLAASNSAGVFVYIYAFMNAGTMTLEMSTTTPTQQVATGVFQKTGDVTRTLVGAAYTDAGGAWADTNGKLWVLSYFNRAPKKSKTNITATLSTSSQTYVEVDSNARNNFINWSDEVANFYTYVPWSNAVATGIYGDNLVDGTVDTGSNNGSSSGPNVPGNIQNTTVISGVTENTTHYGTLFVRCSTSVTTVFGAAASAGEQGAIYVVVRG